MLLVSAEEPGRYDVPAQVAGANLDQARKGRRGTVIKQSRKAKAVLPAGTTINVTLKK